MHSSRFAIVVASAMMLYSLLCRCRRRRVRIRYPVIRSRGSEGTGEKRTSTMIEIVLLIPSRGANCGELFGGNRSSEWRIKGERES